MPNTFPIYHSATLKPEYSEYKHCPLLGLDSSNWEVFTTSWQPYIVQFVVAIITKIILQVLEIRD